MRILVIGGTGFIGTRVIERLAPEHEVTVLHRGKHAPLLPANVRHIAGDRNHLSEHAAAIHAVRPDVVLDMIASDEHQARAVVEAIRGIAPRLVTISSIDVYRVYEVGIRLVPGPLEPVPLTEDSPLRTVLYPARNIPAMSAIFDWVTPDYEKILVEQAVQDQPDLPATIVRLPMVYGPGDPLHRFRDFLQRIDGSPVVQIEETWAAWRGSFGYVEDVASGIALAVTGAAAAGRVYHIAEAEALSWADWVRAVGKGAGWQGQIEILPTDRAPEDLRPPFRAEQHWTADSSRIRRELRYRETVTREEALARTVAWERAQRTTAAP
jgi:nucleoside-diphosphate-sugar epimerase